MSIHKYAGRKKLTVVKSKVLIRTFLVGIHQWVRIEYRMPSICNKESTR